MDGFRETLSIFVFLMKAMMKSGIPIKSGLGMVILLPGLNSLAQSPPNIIFILSDDHSTKAISCYDGSLNHTPNIDALAEQGIRFTNCFCTNAISGPSRASILTGRLGSSNGVINNSTAIDTTAPTFPTLLQGEGYNTALFGKWHINGKPQGFDYVRILPGQGEYYNPDFMQNDTLVRDSGYVNDIVTNDAINWLTKQDSSTPFLLMVHYKAPHRPWLPPLHLIGYYDSIPFDVPPDFFEDYESRTQALQKQKMSVRRDLIPYSDLKLPGIPGSHPVYLTEQDRLSEPERQIWDSLYNIRNQSYPGANADSSSIETWNLKRMLSDYLSTVKSMDDNIGRLVNVLDSLPLSENTIVIYASDQGFFLGEHGLYDKRFFYDQSARMPLIIRNPDLSKGIVNDQLLMNIDLAPSILEMAGFPVPVDMNGKSFTDFIDADSVFRENVYYHYQEYPGEHSVARHVGIRTKDYKLIHYYYPDDEWELFNLAEDPGERNNLFMDPEYQTIRASLIEMLTQQMIYYGDTLTLPLPSTKMVQHLATGSAYHLKSQPSTKYQGKGPFPLTNGLLESGDFEGPGFSNSWCGFEGSDLELRMDVSEIRGASSIVVAFLHAPDSWIFQPAEVSVTLVDKRGNQRILQCQPILQSKRKSGGARVYYEFPIPRGRFEIMELKAKNIGTCPPGHPGAGSPAWLFIDEVQIW